MADYRIVKQVGYLALKALPETAKKQPENSRMHLIP
jgi:hypothetical protein